MVTIPPTISKLTLLRDLKLQNNGFFGRFVSSPAFRRFHTYSLHAPTASVPAGLRCCPLKHLDMSNNR